MLVRTWLSFETREKLKALSKTIGIDQYKLVDLMTDYIIENELLDEVLRKVKPEKKPKVKIEKSNIEIPDYIKKL